MGSVWMYWEGPLPEHLRLCMMSAERRRGGLDFNLVSPETVPRFLPELGGSFALLRRPAHRADYLRTRLVHRYGGLWLDSDMIALQPLESLLNFPSTIDFACQTPGSAIGCFAARAGSELLGRVIEAQRRVIDESQGQFAWNDIGNELFASLGSDYPLHLWPKWALDEIAGGSVRTLLSRTARIDDYLSPNAVVFHICNEVTRPLFDRYLRPGRVLHSSMLVSRLLRRGLDVPEPHSAPAWLDALLDYNSVDLARSAQRKLMRRISNRAQQTSHG